MQDPVLGEPQKEELRVLRPLAKDTWAATHGEAQLHTTTTVVRSPLCVYWHSTSMLSQNLRLKSARSVNVLWLYPGHFACMLHGMEFGTFLTLRSMENCAWSPLNGNV